MEVYARVRSLGGKESKIIKLGFEISFGTRILIFLCPLYLCDTSMYGYVLDSPYSCSGYLSQTVPNSRTIAAVPTSSIRSSHQDLFPGPVKDL